MAKVSFKDMIFKLLKKDEQKLIEEQKIHNHWKKYAGLLKG